MGLHKIKRGLKLPISGEPDQRISQGPPVTRVAVMADDCIGMRPTMFVHVGDTVKRGQALFEDKKNPGVIYTALGAGSVTAINRGARRALQSVVIELSDGERTGQPADDEFQPFESYTGNPPEQLRANEIRALLIESGMWPALRTRPFSKAPAPDATPDALFVTAMDTNPCAPSVAAVMAGKEEDFRRGLALMAKLADGEPVYLCKAPGAEIPGEDHGQVQVEEFDGVHPAGNVGTHIHYLYPVPKERTVWHINYEDVISVGRLFHTGRLDVERTIALAGPQVNEPRLLQTRVGASTDTLTEGELKEGENRVISGSVLSGRTAMGEIHGYLGRFHHQIAVLREGRERQFMGWLWPGKNKFSVTNAFISSILPARTFDFTTTTNGSERAMVPIGTYEAVFPLDIIPTFLLRALVIGDVEEAEALGCLELDEEDIALCSYACPGKYDYGPYLRSILTQIEKEG